MKITFIAQSGFIFETNSGIKFCIDVWLQNPVNPITLDQIPKMDYVFITHDHGDHDMKAGFEIAKRDNAMFISNIDIVKKAAENGVQKTERSSVGGWVKYENLEYIQTHAEHTSDTGIPVGFIIKVDGINIYHMGDTGYYNSFTFYKEAYGIDVLIVPIGARYTMGPIEASFAVRDMQPKFVIPMHYNTSLQIKQDPKEFEKLVQARSFGTKVHALQPKDTVEI